MSSKPYVTIAIVGLLGQAATMEVLAQAQVSHRKGVTTLTLPSTAAQASTIDYVNAQALDLPRAPAPSEAEAQADLINTLTSPQDFGEPGSSPGGRGNGKLSPVFLGTPNVPASDSLEVEPQEFGTSNQPFSTARADLLNLATNTRSPYSPSGKLFFNIGSSTFVCSASLIKRGVIVTAAHCVAQFGARRFHSNWRFVPGYRNGVAPFGTWTVANAFVLTSYFNGSDTCLPSAPGVVCRNDIATLRLNTQGGGLPGTATGFYGFGFNGFGFTGGGLTHITQTGYPVCLDNGQLMERNDSQGFRSAANVNNTLIGSLMCGGSSGGPWLINFGIRPALTGTSNGSFPDANRVVGVTSWGFVSNAVKQQGASPFLNTNIVPLVNMACVPLAPHCT